MTPDRDAATRAPRAHVLGHPLDPIDLSAAARRVVDRALSGRGGTVVTLNPEIVVRARDDAALHGAIASADLCVADGVGIVTENLYPGRFRYVEELQRLGADIRTSGHHAVVRGVPRLSGAPVKAHDIRAGAAMVVAGLAAEGSTEIAGVHHIDRGYDDLVGRLAAVGASIERAGERTVI